MRIGVIGANGKAGSRIAKEALMRGHLVTAVVRNKQKIAGKGFTKVIEKDLFSLNEDDLRDLDVVVGAAGLSFEDQNDDPYQRAVSHLIEILKNLPQTRLIMVGGAASLYTDSEKRHQYLEKIPEQYNSVPADMAKALGILQESNIKWSFFSPAVTFDPNGERTGKYRIGSDFIINNNSGESYISYDDYAVAMVDEIENNFFQCRRFTAVSDSKPKKPTKPQVDDGYYGIMKSRPVFEGLSRYREPFNYELSGKQFKLVMDKGEDLFVKFINGNTLEWSKFADSQVFREYYECAKVDELTYFANFELSDFSPRTNITLVLDMEQRLVTYVRTFTGISTKYPYLVESEINFGAIDIPGFKLPVKRHGYTTDLVGKRAQWNYGPNMSIVHVYYNPKYIRVTFPEDRLPFIQIDPDEAERFPYDEPTDYIKIKEGIYLVNVIEQHRAQRGDTGNSLLFLMDLVRVHDVGRSFGYSSPDNGPINPENYLFAAYGDFVYSDGAIEAKKNVYLE